MAFSSERNKGVPFLTPAGKETKRIIRLRAGREKLLLFFHQRKKSIQKKVFSFAKGTKAFLFLLLQEKEPKEQAKGDPAENAGSPLESLHANLSHQPRGCGSNVGKLSSNQRRASALDKAKSQY